MSKYTKRLITAIILGVVTIGLCLWDYWLSTYFDNDATISKVLLYTFTHAPMTALAFAFWAGLLTGHLYLTQDPLSPADA